jgi:3-deoxy-7-phosphoheptulonate synthase
VSTSDLGTVIVIVGEREVIAGLPLEAYPGVDKVLPILQPYKLVSREFRRSDTIITVGGTRIGGEHVALITGPCSVESREQLLEAATAAKQAGATMLRGGAYKPRTSPYAFQGLGVEGLQILAEAREQTGLPVVTELMDPRHLEAVVEYSDIIQIGARNMQNFQLLSAVGEVDRPVLLKRGLAATIDELLMAAEYIVREGNDQVIICERGIRTFETATRNTLDISAVPIIKKRSHLPVIVDPSHASGKVDLVEPLSLAAIVAGADGLMIEMHPTPETALSDGAQSLDPRQFNAVAARIRDIVAWTGKSLG